MDRKMILVRTGLFLLGVSFAAASSAVVNGSLMKLHSTMRNFELIRAKEGYWLSPDCKKCEAQVVLTLTDREKVKVALDADQRGQVPIGDRLCTGLKGSVWIVLDSKKVQHSVCEFPDRSATLTSDLSDVAHRLLDPER